MNSHAQAPRPSHSSFNAFTQEALFSYLRKITTDVDRSDVVLLGDHEDIATRYIDGDEQCGFVVDMERAGVNLKRCHFLKNIQCEVPVPAQPEHEVVFQEYDLETDEWIGEPQLRPATPATTRSFEMPASLDSEKVKDHLLKMCLFPKTLCGDGEEPLRVRTVVIVDQRENRYLDAFLRETAKLNIRVIFTSLVAPGWFGNPEMPEPTDEVDAEADLVPVPQEESLVIEFVGTWGDETIEERTEWLFDQLIPMTEPCGFTGEADTRKSTLALTIAAAGSTASEWFNRAVNGNEPFSTLYAGTEDSWASVALPRFRAAGGDKRRICRLPLEVKVRRRDLNGNPVELSTPFTLAEYIGQLGKFIDDTNLSARGPVKLLIWDPLISFFGDKDYTSAADATELMNKLKTFQEEHHVASLSIMHHNKTAGQSAKQRTSGSHRISDAHKMLWTFTLDEDDKNVTLITPTKKNLLNKAIGHKITTDPVSLQMPDGSACEYGKVRYLGTTDKTTDGILQEKESPDRGKQKELREAILDALKDGPQQAGKVTHDLLSVASARTIQRCVSQLEQAGKLVKTSPSKNPKDVTWSLPDEQQKLPGGEF
jgi:hypothetical protein